MDYSFDTIYKRKSVRKFVGEKISAQRLAEIEDFVKKLVPLDGSIRVRFETVGRGNTTAKFGEYCILMYSEKKENYLLNAGYMLEQLDLYFAANNIGACWYGLAKPENASVDGLDYVIMIAFGQSSESDFRSSAKEFNRKPAEKLFSSDEAFDALAAAGYAPSACNSQPWKAEQKDGRLFVYRDPAVRTFIPKSKLSYFNSIDMGIFLLFLELSLNHFGFRYERELCCEADSGEELIETARYRFL